MIFSIKASIIFWRVIFPEYPSKYKVAIFDLIRLPGAPIAYWASETQREIFQNSKKLGQIFEIRQGL